MDTTNVSGMGTIGDFNDKVKSQQEKVKRVNKRKSKESTRESQKSQQEKGQTMHKSHGITSKTNLNHVDLPRPD